MNKTYTKGNVIVEEIEIGDIHYEFEYGIGVKVEAISKPSRNDIGYWVWQSKIISRPDEIIDYGVSESGSHYAPKLYDYIAYKGYTII